jgi:hypothetical protein
MEWFREQIILIPGFRLPTNAEFEAEAIYGSSDAYTKA